jgi:glycosyltransferase involved in cell wall biosynthesis
MTKVSVVIPSYNRPQWLLEAVRSVQAQTLRDLEIIIVDDGSDLKSSLMQEFSSDRRLRFERRPHRGASAARNFGIALASGEYIAFLDSDDLFLPQKLAIQVAAMDASPRSLMSHTSYARMDSTGTDLQVVSAGRFDGAVYPQIIRECPIATPTVMLRRDLLLASGLAFDEGVSVGEDVMLWVDIARLQPLLGIDIPLTKVRLHGANAYFDPLAQLTGGMNILSHAFEADPGLGRGFRRASRARILAIVARMYLAQGDERSALKYCARALAEHPVGVETWRLTAVLLLPPHWRPLLRTLRNLMSSWASKDGTGSRAPWRH